MATASRMDEGEIRRLIMAIHLDTSLTETEKAQKRQELMSGSWKQATADDTQRDGSQDDKGKSQAIAKADEEATIFDETLQCAMCMELCSRPVTAPCQHNFCLGCFNKWVAQGKKTCPTCRSGFPNKFAANPRINTALASAIRMAKLGVQRPNNSKVFERINDKDRPDEAFTTDRAVRAGRANAASGRIMVTVPGDHFGPIPPENDPRGTGILVGEFWKDRLDCRQWGAHFPHVAGIAGQSHTGSQSVVLSGGYEDDRDEGEWFLYTGSGGRDLSGNKRVNNVQSFDQTFEKMNKALLLSCQKGLPVRVVRSFKEKRSAYAPTEDQPVRYDGIYRILRAYRKPGNQGKLVCRYLFSRCDNSPAPWSSEDNGDGPWDGQIPKEALVEIKQASGRVYEMADGAWWDYDEEKKQWGWSRAPPISQKMGGDGTSSPKKARRKVTEHERALRDFQCKLCSGVLKLPLSTPCGHHFCKPCLETVFEGVGDLENRATNAGRALRERKTIKPCPACKADISEFLSTAQVNRGMMEVISKLQDAVKSAKAEAADAEASEPTVADAADEELADDAVAMEEGANDDEEGGSDNAAADAPVAAPPAAVSAPPAPPATLQAPPAAKETELARAARELEALCAEFPQFDKALLEGMLEDQGGDIQEVHACLRRMVNQTLAAERKAKKAAAGEAGPSGPAPEGRKRKAAPAASAADEQSAAEETAAEAEADAAVASDAEALAEVPSVPAKKGRGRPSKAAVKGDPSAEEANVAEAEPAPEVTAKKRRGRPPKATTAGKAVAKKPKARSRSPAAPEDVAASEDAVAQQTQDQE